MLKKIFIILIIILLVGAGIVSYFLFFSPKAAEQGTNDGFSLSDIFPFGDNGITPGDKTTTPSTPDETPTTPGEPTGPIKAPKLIMIAKGPIAGAAVFDVMREKPQDPTKVGPDGKPLPIELEPATKVRFTEVTTGHTNETYLDLIDIKKITTTTIPKIAESFFAGKGATTAILRYTEDDINIETFAGNIPLIALKNGAPDTTLKGSYLTENILALAVSPDREKIFSITKTTDGSTGTISLPDGTKKNQLFSLAFSEWTTEWPNTKFVTITTKPSSKVPGYSYSIDTTTKVMKKVIGNIFGLTTLTSPDMKTILMSRSSNNTFTSSIYNIQAKTVVPLPGATTLPEKCVWQSATILYCAVPSYIPAGEYPDAWYQGSVSFVDQIYKIDTKNYSATVIGTPANVGAAIDAINLTVDPSNTFLVFTNKKDGALWSLDLRAE